VQRCDHELNRNSNLPIEILSYMVKFCKMKVKFSNLNFYVSIEVKKNLDLVWCGSRTGGFSTSFARQTHRSRIERIIREKALLMPDRRIRSLKKWLRLGSSDTGGGAARMKRSKWPLKKFHRNSPILLCLTNVYLIALNFAL